MVIGIIAALCAGYIIGILVNYPPVAKSDLAGTFGKAEKFHKVQMTAKDIQLRSELLKDTAKLKSMIQGLVYFSLFTEDVRTKVDLADITFRAKGMGALPGEADIDKALVDYADFIRNNNNTLNTTVELLTGFYYKKSTDLTQDVEKTMREFGAYVNNINEKNIVLISALKSMDNFMLTNKTLQAHKEEILQLKSIRDQLLIKGIQFGGILNNKKQVSTMVSYALSSQNQFSAVLLNFGYTASTNYGAINSIFQSQTNLSSKVSDNIGVTIGNQVLGSGQSVVYNSVSLGFMSSDQLHIYSSQGMSGVGNLQIVPIASYIVGSQTLNVNLPIYSVTDFIHSQGYNNGLVSGMALNSSAIFSTSSLNNMIGSAAGLGNIINAVVLSQGSLGVN